MREALPDRRKETLKDPPRATCRVQGVPHLLEISEASAIMQALRPGYRENLIPEKTGDIDVNIHINLRLFDCLEKWMHVHEREKEMTDERDKVLLAKHDMKNLVAYTWIYLLGEGVVVAGLLDRVLRHVQRLVFRATEGELDGFLKLLDSPDHVQDEKLNELSRALVMRRLGLEPYDDLQGVRVGLRGRIRNWFRTS